MIRVPEHKLSWIFAELKIFDRPLPSTAEYPVETPRSTACLFSFLETCKIQFSTFITWANNQKKSETLWEQMRPYLEDCVIFRARLLLKSYRKYLKPYNCCSISNSNFLSALLCSFAKYEASSKHPSPYLCGLRILRPGKHPNSPKFRNTNFLPPLLCIACRKSGDYF